MKEINGIKVLETKDIETYCPSFYATHPTPEVSDKYTFLNTYDISLQLWDNGWMPTYAREQRSNKEENKGFTRHVVRWAHRDFAVNGERIEIVGVNSHNLSASFSLMAGVYRLVCSNGMIAQTGDLGSFKIKHIGDIGEQVQIAVDGISKTASKIAGSIGAFKTIDLSLNEQGVFASAAHGYMYPEAEKAPIQPTALLKCRRAADNTNDLWATFNRIQENAVKGGLRGRSATGRKTRTRAIKDIGRDVKLNKALWAMADKMAAIKKAA